MQVLFNRVMPCWRRQNFDGCFSVQLKINFPMLCYILNLQCFKVSYKRWECSLTRRSLTYVRMSFWRLTLRKLHLHSTQTGTSINYLVYWSFSFQYVYSQICITYQLADLREHFLGFKLAPFVCDNMCIHLLFMFSVFHLFVSLYTSSIVCQYNHLPFQYHLAQYLNYTLHCFECTKYVFPHIAKQ